MYCASFIWEPGVYDAEFHRLNAAIDAVARSLPGFLGVDSWQSQDGLRKCANYYWGDLDTLKVFSTHPTHQEAKRQYARWYKGYHIVVSEVIRSYGDGNLPHITPNERRRPSELSRRFSQQHRQPDGRKSCPAPETPNSAEPCSLRPGPCF